MKIAKIARTGFVRVGFKPAPTPTPMAMIAIFAIALVMISCGGGNSSNNASDKKTDTEATKEVATKAESKSVNVDNWQAFVKKEFGVDLAIPNGWKFSQVREASFSENNVTLLVMFEKAGENAVAVSETAKSLFDQTNALSTEGIFLIDVSNSSSTMKKGETFATFDDRFKPSMMYDGVSDIETYWYYKAADVVKCVDISAKKGRMRIKFDYDKQIKL